MDTTPIWITFLHNYIAGFLMPWLGLLLVNIKPPMKKICIIALFYGVLGILLRSIINLSFDFSFFMQIMLLIITVMIIFNLSLFKSIIATVLGTIVLTLGEMVFSIITLNIFPHIETSSNIIAMLFIPLPQILMTLCVIYLCIHFNFNLFDFEDTNFDPSVIESKRIKTIAGLVLVLLIVIVVQIAFNMNVINQEYTFFNSLPLSTIGIVSTIILILGVITMPFLIMQLVELTQKESQFHNQAIYIKTLDELYTAIRSERHDIINHLQTIYGFNQMGYTDEVQGYLKELLGGSVLSNEFTITGTPGLTALFYIKSGIAKTHQIKFNIDVSQKIDSLRLSAYELNNILGNLINNAFDAVMLQDTSQRLVNVNIGADNENYFIKVSNYGYIDDSSKQNLFRKGFSTKTGEHSGLGLHICNSLVKKYGGRIEIENGENHMVEFGVFFPIKMEEGEPYESTGQETSSLTC